MTTTVDPYVSIVIISYNTRDMTLACIRSVLAETKTPHEVIVLDNASTDGSAEAIAAAFPEVQLICETQNHGFGPAHPIAVEKARSDWILLLNPDTVVLDGALDALIRFADQTPDAGIWGGRTLYEDGSLNPTSCFRRMTLWSVTCRLLGLNGLFRHSELFNSEYYGNWARDSEREVDIVTGCLFLLRREFWITLGGFDPAFTMYGEEVDFCLRAKAMGARPRITPEATIIHHGGASQTVKADKMVRLMRAKMELISRHFPKGQKALGLSLFRLWPVTRMIAFGAMARFMPTQKIRHRTRHSSSVWIEVWQRRIEWERGFSPAPYRAEEAAL